MASSYSTPGRLELQADGENDDTWGSRTNTNLQMVEEFAGGYVAVALSSTSKTLTTQNAATDESRPKTCVFSGSPGGTCTVTVPDVKHLRLYVNNSDQSVVIDTTGGGTTVTIPASESRLVYTDGATNAVDGLGLTSAAFSTITAFGQSLIDDSDAATARTTLGLVIGTNVQAYNALLGDIAGLTVSPGDILYVDASSDIVRLAKGTNGQFLKIGATIPEWADVPGGGDMLAANNLSDVVSASTARTNLGLAIGTNVQAYSANLAAIAALAVTDGNIIVGNGSAWVAESGATARASLGLTIGTHVQAYSAQLTTWAGISNPSGDVVGTSDTQSLTNKTLTQPTLVLKQGLTPAPTAEGDIQWDTDGNQIKIGDGASTLTFSDDSKLSPLAGSGSITTLGTVTTGTWNADPIDLTAYVTGDLPFANIAQLGAYQIALRNAGTTGDIAGVKIGSLTQEASPGTGVKLMAETAAGALGYVAWDDLPGIGSGAPDDASYVVLGTNGTLSAERVLTAGALIDITDGGAGTTVTIDVDLSELTTDDGTIFEAADFIPFVDATNNNQYKITAANFITDRDIRTGTVAVAKGGTGATDAATARSNLGLAIGSNVQSHSARLDDLAALAVTDGNIIVGNGSTWVAETGATARASLGLVIGTDVQAQDAALQDIADLTLTRGDLFTVDATGNITNLGVGSSGQFVTTDGTDVSWGDAPSDVDQILYASYELNSASAGGLTSGGWNTYVATLTQRRNSITGASYASNVFTLPAGTYEVHFGMSAYKVGDFQCRLYQTTPTVGAVDVRSANGFSNTGTSASNQQTTGAGVFTLAAQENLTFQYRVDTTRATDGVGQQNSWAETTLYAWVHIRKIA